MNRLGLDDVAVIEASRAEPDRFASLFDRHAPYIHRYLARRVGRQAADDLVAETFLVAFRKRTGYDPRFPDARPWLYGIATNLIAQHRRQEARQLRLRHASGPDPVQHDHANGPMNGKIQKSVQLGCVNGSRTFRTPGYNGKPYKRGHDPIKKRVPDDGRPSWTGPARCPEPGHAPSPFGSMSVPDVPAQEKSLVLQHVG
jgi:hypothetical protein